MNSTLLRIATFMAIVYMALGQDKSCIELQKKGETGIRKLILVDTNSKLPKTEADLTEYCNNGKNLYKGLREYKNCLKPLAQEMVGTALKSIAKVLKKHCGDKEGRTESLKVLNCAPDDTIVKTRQCASLTLNILEHLGNTGVSAKDVIPQVCCMTHMTTECIQDKIKSSCKNVNVNEYFDQLVSAISKDVVELACEDYKTLKQCEKRMPDAMRKLREVGNKPSGPIANRNFVAPLLKIGEKLTD